MFLILLFHMIISAGRAIVDGGTRLEREAGYPHWTAGFMLEGQIEVSTETQLLRVQEQACVIIAPRTPYELTITRKQNQIWMIFDPRESLREHLLAASRNQKAYKLSFHREPDWREIHEGLESLLHWWNGDPPHLALAENAMERVLLTAAWIHEGQDQTSPDSRLVKVVDHISRELGNELTIESLAKVAGLSASRFAHVFKDQMGVTPMAYLESRRIEQARQLLLGADHSIQQIAFDCGFPNSQHFSTRFRKVCGQSPSSFRKAALRRFGELFPKE